MLAAGWAKSGKELSSRAEGEPSEVAVLASLHGRDNCVQLRGASPWEGRRKAEKPLLRQSMSG